MRGVKADGLLMAEIAKNSSLITLAQFMNKTEEYINQEELVETLQRPKKRRIKPSKMARRSHSVPRRKKRKIRRRRGKSLAYHL
jgi:hypothetical protein